MTAKPVVLRSVAQRDIDDAVAHYTREADTSTAHAFVDALEDALSQIGELPGSGSLQFAHDLDLPNLRSWPLQRFRHIVFYVERDDSVDVWRILHERRHIKPLLNV